MLLHDFLNLRLLQIFLKTILDVEDNPGTTAKARALLIQLNGEGTTSAGFPEVLFVIVGLGDDLNLIGDKVSRVETNTELTDHGDVCTGGESLHELLGT